MANLLQQFARAVAADPDGVAIVDGRGRETRFRDLDAQRQELAARWHAQGIRRGDRVLLAMPVDATLYASLAALWSLGAAVVLPEPAMGLKGLRHALRVTGAKAFCASGWYLLILLLLPRLWGRALLRPGRARGRSAPALEVSGQDIALISFTSGTTGAPKAIPRSHGFLQAQYDAVAPILRSDRAERDLVCFPVFTLINLAERRCSVLPNWPMRKLASVQPDDLASWILAQRVTRALMPPALCDTLCNATRAPQLQDVFTGGGPVFPDMIESLTAATGARVTCVYGSTEAEPIAHLRSADLSDADQARMRDGAGLLVGHPVPDILLRICEDEVQVAGAHVNKGYLDPAQDAANKIPGGPLIWHRTGDAGRLDSAGRLWLLGRIGTMVATARGPVYPFAIEVSARYWPGVVNSALMPWEGAALLVVEGDVQHMAEWRAQAAAVGVSKLVHLARIPMDARHVSKVDRAALSAMLTSMRL